MGDTQKNCEKPTYLGSETKLGMTVGQMIAIIGLCFAIASNYISWQYQAKDLENRISVVESRQLMRDDKQDKFNEELKNNVNEIKQTMIEIKGQLNLKQDRFK